MNVNEPEWLIFGDVHNPMVWTVDDDWFENDKAMLVLPRKKIGGDLGKLIEQIDALASVTPNTTGMLLYLGKLATECLNKNLSLYVCGFDRFEAKFAYANRSGNAILLDVYHSSPDPRRLFKSYTHPDNAGAVYGIHLLAELLDGVPFVGDIFFVTQYPDLPQREISECMKSQPSVSKWWPLKNISGLTVNKNVHSELETFFTYFVESLPPEPKRIDFDIKFVIQLPIAPMVGRLDVSYVSDIVNGNEDFSPFLVPMIKEFGLGTGIRDLQRAFRTEHATYCKRLARAVSVEVVQNEMAENYDRSDEDQIFKDKFHQTIEELTAVQLGNCTIDYSDSQREAKQNLASAFNIFVARIPNLKSHLTLQDWAYVKVAPQLSKRINALLQEFEGVTRFDFARGSWLPPKDKEQSQAGEDVPAIDDLLVIVEFLTKRSKVSREIVEKYVVEPILGKDREMATIIQEIPIEGFMHKRRPNPASELARGAEFDEVPKATKEES
jgi:hypothetical protein